MGSRKVIAIGAVGFLALGLLTGGAYTGYRAYKDAQFKSQACAVIKQQQADRGPVITIPGANPHVAIIGDSYSSGDTLDNYQDAWPFAFAADTGDTVTLSGIGWTGFVDGGVCDTDAFGSRTAIADGADLVIIEGGLNDIPTPNGVAAAVDEMVGKIGASRVVIVGPADTPATQGEEAIDAILRDATTEAGAKYVSALNWKLTFGPDQTHLDPAGHKAFAQNVADAIRD